MEGCCSLKGQLKIPEQAMACFSDTTALQPSRRKGTGPAKRLLMWQFAFTLTFLLSAPENIRAEKC